MGDGVLIYFGYPQAHEDDAERAVRSGLGLIAAVSDLKTHAPLKTRVGIATGLVVVGDLIGSGASRSKRSSARRQISRRACRALRSRTVWSLLKARGSSWATCSSLRTWSETSRASRGRCEPGWPCVRLRWRAASRLFTRAVDRACRAGRRTRTATAAVVKAKTGEGQVVLLSGEPGIGKSRLTAALLERLAAKPHTRLRNFCSPQHTDSALYPTSARLSAPLDLGHDDAPQAKHDKLDALLAQSSTSPHDAALLAEMLSLPNDGRYPALELTPQQRRQKTLEALVHKSAALARQNPVLMIFEDAHWTDPTSLELFGRIVDKIPAFRVLLIVTYRPEFEPPWIGRPHVTALTLNRLGEREIAAMIDRVTGNKALPESIRQDIIERTDGIPLFVEEMTKAVLEAETKATLEALSPPFRLRLAVPASLHASLMARLDRLGPAKEVAQIGAAIGREFSHALLAAVVRKPEAELQSALERLMRQVCCSGRCAAAGDLPVQACTCAGCSLWHAASRAATRASRTHC